METTREDDYAELTRELSNLDKAHLIELGRELGLLDSELTGTLRTISTVVRAKVETTLDEADEEIEEINSLRNQISAFNLNNANETPADTGNIEAGGQDKVVGATPIVEAQGSESLIGGKVSGDISRTVVPSFDGASIMSEGNGGRLIFKGQAKIKGIVGKGLSYVSLVRQVDVLRADHPVRDIIEAVIQSVDANLPLRSFLDSKTDIDLQGLLSIIKSACRETDSTTLFMKLSNTIQSHDEDAVSFLIKLMEIKAKIIFSSENSDVTYSKDQVQKVFLKGLENGLLDEAVRTKFRSFLRTEASDEKLLEKLTEIVVEEKDRDAKMQKNMKSRIRQVEVKESDKVNELKDMVKELTAEVKTLKAEHSEQRRDTRARRGCRSCREKGWGMSCKHCFRCGSEGHFSRDCNSLNGQGLTSVGSRQ